MLLFVAVASYLLLFAACWFMGCVLFAGVCYCVMCAVCCCVSLCVACCLELFAVCCLLRVVLCCVVCEWLLLYVVVC